MFALIEVACEKVFNLIRLINRVTFKLIWQNICLICCLKSWSCFETWVPSLTGQEPSILIPDLHRIVLETDYSYAALSTRPPSGQFVVGSWLPSSTGESSTHCTCTLLMSNLYSTQTKDGLGLHETTRMIPPTTSESGSGLSDINAAWIHHVSVLLLGDGILMPSVNLISPSLCHHDEDEDEEEDVLIRLNMGQGIR